MLLQDPITGLLKAEDKRIAIVLFIVADVFKIKRQSWKKNNAETIIKASLSFILFLSFYLARQTLGRDSLKHEEPLHSRAMSLLLVSWVKVDVSHAGLASICHQPEKSTAISRRYAGDPQRTVIHGKWNYKSHPTSGNIPFYTCVRLRSKCINVNDTARAYDLKKRVDFRQQEIRQACIRQCVIGY